MRLPTIAETLPGHETVFWNAFFAPSGTPKPIIDRLNTALLAALADPEAEARLKEPSSIVVGFTPEQFATHVQTELAKLVQIAKASGAQLA